MPLNVDPELLNELVKRQVMEQQMDERFAPREASSPVLPTTMSPSTLSVLGGIADGATTYQFLKNGTSSESNAMLNGLSPAQTGLAVAGMGAGSALLSKVLKKKLPSSVIDAILANLGARQTVMAASGVDPDRSESGFGVANRLLRLGK